MKTPARFGLILCILLLACFSPALFAATVNISKFAGNQSESSVVINPTNPLNIVAFSNEASSNNTFRAFSTDGGATWTGGDININAACCDGQAVAFDQFGNLFLVYIDGTVSKINLIVSTNGGSTFSAPTTVGTGSIDQPSIAAGSGSLWVDWNSGGSMVAKGAPVTGLGVFGPFGAQQAIPSSSGCSFGGIAVGPGTNGGKVIVVCQNPTSGQGPATIFANVDADGLGAGGFGARITVTTTNVGGFDFIPAQNGRSIDAESGVVWDTTGGAFNNRIYLVYVEETSPENNDTNILVRTSDNDGATWSAPIKVNDDGGTRSQFNPYVSLDEKTGVIGVTFHDCRNDSGTPGPGGTNGTPNDDAQYFASFSTDGGATWGTNVQLSCGFSNAAAAANGIDYGDYVGTETYCGVVAGVWADNSNCTGDNPAGTLHAFDLYANTLKFGANMSLNDTLPDGSTGVAYSGTITATGGVGASTFSLVTAPATLPPGLTLNANGTITGTPNQAGTFNFAVAAVDTSHGCVIRKYTVVITSGCPTISLDDVLLDGTVGTPYSGTITASGGTGPYTYAVTSAAGTFPPGLNLASNGTISGTPTTGGTFNFDVTATDTSNNCTGVRSYTVVITTTCPTITLDDILPDGSVGTPYSSSITASGGTGPYTYAVTSGTFPQGLTLNANGTVTGTPTAGGTFNFDVTATDTSSSCTGVRSYTVVITGGPACIFCDDFSSMNFQTSFGPWTMKPSASYSAATGDAVGTTSKKADLTSPDFGKCSTCTFEAHMKIQTNGRISLFGWYGDKKHNVELKLSQDKQKIEIKQKSGTLSRKASVSFTIVANQLYDVSMTYNGTNFQVSIDSVAIPGLTITPVAVPSGNAMFEVKATGGSTVTGTIADISVF